MELDDSFLSFCAHKREDVGDFDSFGVGGFFLMKLLFLLRYSRSINNLIFSSY